MQKISFGLADGSLIAHSPRVISTRREFLARATGMGALTLAASNRAAESPARITFKICLFEKPVQSLTADELAAFAAGMGFDGLSITLRRGGRIAPEQATEALPQLAETLARRGLEITELTTDITSARQPHAEVVLRTAAKLGIRRYRTGSLKYALDRPIPAQLDAFRVQFTELAALNRSLGIGGYYQVHAGANAVGAPVWDLHQLVKDYPVEVLGIAWDTRHAAVEGGLCWPTNFRLARPHIGIVYAKDFVWQGHKAVNVPLGQGMVDTQFWRLLRESGYTGPINLHVEYPVPPARNELTAAVRRDLETLRQWLG